MGVVSHTILWRNLTLSVALTGSALTFLPATAADNSQLRKTYLAAREALDKRKQAQYEKLRAQLDDYPLNIYLDFHEQQDKILALPGDAAVTALTPFLGSPLYDTLKHRYLERAANRRHWQDFLAMSPVAPRSDSLQCLFYVAQYETGHLEMAWQGAEMLWLSGQSQPKECDPLFDNWTKAGLRSESLLWQRIILSFDNGQSRLLSYLVQRATSTQAYAKLLYEVYRNPQKIRDIKQFSKSEPVYGEIVRGGIMRLAVRDIEQAVRLFDQYRDAGRFSEFQQQELQHFLIYRALLRREDTLKQYADERLVKQPDDTLLEMRIRWALAEGDDKTVANMLPLLSDEESQNARWRYWRVKLRVGTELDRQLLLQERNFYGFTAAYEEGVQPQLQLAALPDKLDNAKLLKDQGMQRIVELMAIDKTIDAKLEWRDLMERHTPEERIEYGQYALQQGWYNLSVDSSISAKAWDHLELRFPVVHPELYSKYAKQFNTDEFQLMSIARRESAFYPYATSSAGARGFMQLMPKTAKLTASQYKLTYHGTRSLYDPAINIPLGSAYFGGLLKQFNGNRVLATASYNAGPYRVKQWLKQSSGKLDVMQFIESIPYRETREYVQGVFSYRMIYEQQQQLNKPFFTKQEFSRSY
ncbi:transglycosylase SLT domain-containing protein [Shewanella sp.]|uniref:transglycosylase SLT domain-containing protein n=1 Tax=Shewanella sp. TaxID=50422 RepID=UPI003A9711A1